MGSQAAQAAPGTPGWAAWSPRRGTCPQVRGAAAGLLGRAGVPAAPGASGRKPKPERLGRGIPTRAWAPSQGLSGQEPAAVPSPPAPPACPLHPGPGANLRPLLTAFPLTITPVLCRLAARGAPEQGLFRVPAVLLQHHTWLLGRKGSQECSRRGGAGMLSGVEETPASPSRWPLSALCFTARW